MSKKDSKKQQAPKAPKKKTIIVKEKSDGTNEVIITKAPSKTLFGRIVIAILAFSMIAAVIISFIIVIYQAA